MHYPDKSTMYLLVVHVLCMQTACTESMAHELLHAMQRLLRLVVGGVVFVLFAICAFLVVGAGGGVGVSGGHHCHSCFVVAWFQLSEPSELPAVPPLARLYGRKLIGPKEVGGDCKPPNQYAWAGARSCCA